MKKFLLYFSILLGATSLVSCEEDLDIWDSETLEYSGRFVYQVLAEDGTTVISDFGSKDGQEIQIFNTAANQKNQIWIEDMTGEVIADYSLKVKQTLSGNASNFASVSTAYEDLEVNQAAIDEVVAYLNENYAPDAADQNEFMDEVCLKAAIESGSVVKGGFTTKAGNVTDGISMKIRLLYGTVNVKSYTLPESTWADPKVPEYAWKYDSIEYDKNLDKVLVIKGYRYTGFPEDAL